MGKRRMSWHTYDTEVEFNNVNKENQDLIKEYLEYISATDRSPQTREKYLHNLKLFFVWVLKEKDNKFFADLKKRDYMGWLSYLVDKQELSPSRVRTLRSTVSSLANFCENILADEDDRFENYRNLILKIPAPALEKVRDKTYLTEEQIDQLLKYLEIKQDWKKCLYVVISFATGARKGEIVQFKRSDFTPETLNNGMYRTANVRCKGRGRLGKTRQFLVAADMVDKYLKLYLDTRTDDFPDLFVVKHHSEIKPLQSNVFNEWCDGFSKVLGVEVFPHAFRASIATVLRDKNKDITKIQKLLGHKDLTTTMIYIKENDEDDIEALFRE